MPDILNHGLLYSSGSGTSRRSPALLNASGVWCMTTSTNLSPVCCQSGCSGCEFIRGSVVTVSTDGTSYCNCEGLYNFPSCDGGGWAGNFSNDAGADNYYLYVWMDSGSNNILNAVIQINGFQQYSGEGPWPFTYDCEASGITVSFSLAGNDYAEWAGYGDCTGFTANVVITPP
jgi:hypothetical protein